MWLLFLGFNLVGLSGYNLILRRAILDKVDRFSLVIIMSTAIALPLVFVMIFAPPHLSRYSAPDLWLLAATIAGAIALHVTNVKALQYLEASVYSVLYNLRIIFTTFMGIIFLNEKIAALKIIGGLVIFLAILTVRQRGKKQLTRRGLEWGIGAALAVSLLNLTSKSLYNRLPYLTVAIPVNLLAVIIMWSIFLAQGRRLKLSLFKDPQILLLMFFRALSAYGFDLALYNRGGLGVTSYISSLSVIIIVILGVVLLGERDYLRRKIVATGLALLGLTFILIGAA